ncbi:hypothetical protein RvY_00039-2 [Ramazzottius varieornatus]|uniref:Piwi domain-containing protein n=1 Tax=Ramazzottius varieornatus TaxID=947166 RepID=A0A1D1UFI1_RAMVA|nr:hypothetical protein RvY_00039-2 [Ramazzottius varieornatus]
MLKAFTQEVTMVLGADVTHPGFGEDVGKPSVAAVVASTNETYTEYVAEVRAQHKKVQESTSLKKKSKTQEIITDLGDMVLDLLEKFYTVNNKALPTLIIFYRDGVSEGQYKEVMKMEVEAIREACFEAYADKPIPPITYIIVGKRHHIRLFATNPADQAGRAKNVPTGTVDFSRVRTQWIPCEKQARWGRGVCFFSSGTIADVKITHFSEFDYYLCSHGGIQVCDNHNTSNETNRWTTSYGLTFVTENRELLIQPTTMSFTTTPR